MLLLPSDMPYLTHILPQPPTYVNAYLAPRGQAHHIVTSNDALDHTLSKAFWSDPKIPHAHISHTLNLEMANTWEIGENIFFDAKPSRPSSAHHATNTQPT